MDVAASQHAAGASRRRLAPGGVVVLTLSAVSPAASIFVTGAALLRLAGTGAALAAVLGAVAVNIMALTYAELGSAVPSAGGVYPGIARLLGPGANAAAVALGLVTAPASVAFSCLGFAAYLQEALPGVATLALALAGLAAATLLALLNLRAAALVTGALLGTEMLGVGAVVLVAALHPQRSLADALLHPVTVGAGGGLAPTPPLTMMLAVTAGAFCCVGSQLALNLCEDMRAPPPAIGRLLAITSVIATLVIAGPILLLAIGLDDLPATLADPAPIAHWLRRAAGPAFAWTVIAAVVVAIFNNIVAGLLVFSRFLASTGRDRLWPGAIGAGLARVGAGSGVPRMAVLALAAISALLCLAGEHRLLLLIAGEVFTPALVVVAVLIGRRRGMTGRDSFRSPFFPMLPLVALLVIAAFLAFDWADRATGRVSLLLLAGVALAGFAVGGRGRRRR